MRAGCPRTTFYVKSGHLHRHGASLKHLDPWVMDDFAKKKWDKTHIDWHSMRS